MGQKLLIESFLLFNLEETSEITSHHKQTSSNQQRFQKHVHSLVDVFEKYDHPFTEESQDLIVLDSWDIVSYHVTETTPNIERIEKEQFQVFLSNRLISKEKSLHDPIKQNNFSIFLSGQSDEKEIQRKMKLQLWRNVFSCLLNCTFPVKCAMVT